MSKPKRVKRMVVPVYGIALSFVCGAGQARKLGYDMEDRHAGCVWYDYSKSDVCMVIAEDSLKSRNTLAHEALHAAWRILDMVGVKVEADNHEALAYLVGWVADELDKWALPLAEKLGGGE